MGLREKVTLAIVIIALIQIACRHCMPRTPRKASLKRYLNDLKPVKNNPVPTPYSSSRVNKTPKQTFGKTAQNGEISQNSLPKKSLYKAYNFPENEYPLDNSPRDPFRIGMNFNDNNHVHTQQKAPNLQSSVLRDLKKEMKMKRKLLSNKQLNNENNQQKTNFPENEYPLDNSPRDPFRFGMNFNDHNHMHTLQKAPGVQSSALNDLKKEMKMKRKLLNNAQVNNENNQQKTNFPENEYPLDNSPRDLFGIGMNFNENNHMHTLQKVSNLQSSGINNLKKEMKMKRKLLSNKQVNNENSQLKTEMSSINPASPSSIRSFDTGTFPEVQYPLNTMETWGPNYWNYLSISPEKPFQRFGQNTFNSKEDFNQPFTRLAKAKANKYLQSYDELKKEHRHTSTENSKRSNVGQTGLNFTKTATCETVSDDFISVGLVSNISTNSKEMKKALSSSTTITSSSESTCPVTEYPYHPVPIPYKVSENNNENISPALELKYNTEELADVDNTDIAQTLQLIQEILINDDTCSPVSPGNFSNILEKNMNISDCSDIPENEDIPIILEDYAKNITNTPSQESSQEVEVSDDMASVGILKNNLASVPEEIIPENISTVPDPLNVRMPLPFSDLLQEIEELTNTPKSGLSMMEPLSNGFAVPSPTSIIIIPMNNNVAGKSKKHMFETTSDTPIIVYLPFTQTTPCNQTLSPSFNNTVPNKQLYNVLSKMSPLQNDHTFSPAVVTELLNRDLDSRSSLPIVESLPTNSMRYNNENSPSSMREKPFSHIKLLKSLTDDLPFVSTTRDEKMSEQTIETGALDVNTKTLPTTDYKHSLFDFSDSAFTSLSHGPYNNVLNSELPLIARQIDSDHQVLNYSSKDFFPTLNVTSEHLHKTSSIDSVSEAPSYEIPNDVPPVAINKNLSSVNATDSIEILKTNTPLSESISDLQDPADTFTESLPQPLDKILYSNTLIKPPSAQLPQPKKSLLSTSQVSNNFSDKLPEIMDAVLSTTPVSVTTPDRTSQPTDNARLTETNTSMVDMTLKTELYKIREILDKMLSIETPTYSPPSIDTKLLPINDPDGLLLPKNEVSTEYPPVRAAGITPLPLTATDSPVDSLRQVHETLPPILVDATRPVNLPLPGNILLFQNKLLDNNLIDTQSLTTYEVGPPTVETETSADNKPYLLENLATPLFETVTSRTKDAPNNSLPLKKDLKFPNICDASSDDLPLSVDDLQTSAKVVVHPQHTTTTAVSTHNLSKHVIGNLTQVCNLPKPTNVLSLPADEVVDVSSEVTTCSGKTMSGFTDKLLQDFSSSKVASNGLPNLPINMSKLPIHETFPNGYFKEILSTSPPQNNNLPSSVEKLKQDLSFPIAFTNEPSLDHLPSIVTDNKIEIPQSSVDTKVLSVVLEHLLSPENGVTPESVVTDITDIHDIPRDELTSPVYKLSPPTDYKLTNLPLSISTCTTSKLPMTKALLNNSELNPGGLPSVTKVLPDTSHVLLDKTIHNFEVKYPLSETKSFPLRPVEKVFPNLEHNDNGPFSEKPVDTLISDNPLQLLPTDKMQNNKTFTVKDKIQDHEKFDTKSLEEPTLDFQVPIERVSPLKNIAKAPSSSKLPITKELLENVLSELTRRGFLVPVAQSLPVISPSVLDKTNYSSIPHFNEESHTPLIDKIPLDLSIPNHQTDSLPISAENIVPLGKDKTFSESQTLHIPIELSSPIHNLGLDITNKSVSDIEQDESENSYFKKVSSASPIEGILYHSTDTPSELTLPDTNAPSSSKLPITKELLENVLSEITRRGFSVPVAQSLPVTSPSVLDRTHSSHIPHFTEDSPTPAIHKIQLDPSIPNHQTNSLPISAENSVPLPIDKTFLELQTSHIPTDLSSPIHNLGLDITNKSVSDREQDESENSSSKKVSSASPIEGIQPHSKDTPSELILPDTNAPSSSKLPITKELLENVLSEITRRGFSVPVVQSLPVTSPSVLDRIHSSHILHFTEDSPTTPVDVILLDSSLSNHEIDSLPISGENIRPLPIDKTFSELQTIHIPTDLSSPIHNLGLHITNKSVSGIEQTESEKSSSKKVSSASPIEGILSHSTDTPSELTLPDTNAPSSSKLPITKELLENVLSEITRRGFSVPVAQSLPIRSPLVLDRTHSSHIPHFTEDSPTPAIHKIQLDPSIPNHHTNSLPISAENSVPLPIDKTFLELQTSHIPTDLSSPIHNLGLDITNKSVSDREQDESENSSSKKVSSASPIEGIQPHSKDTPSELILPDTNAPSSSKLPITKKLLENVLSEITRMGFSVPVAQSLPVTSASVLDRIHSSHILHFTEDSPTTPVDVILLDSSLSNHEIDSFPISAENIRPLLIDKTFSELQTLHIPTDLSSPIHNLGLYITNKSVSGIEQTESENLSSKKVFSASPIEGILSHSKDTPSELTLPDTNAPSSSKLPITKELLENVLSEITRRGFSVPVAQSLPIRSSSVLDRTHSSHIPHFTGDSPKPSIDKILLEPSIPNQQTDSLQNFSENVVPLPIDKTFSELQNLHIPTELSSPIQNLGLDITNKSVSDIEQDESENSSSKKVSSASPIEEILSHSKDTPSELTLPDTNAPSSSKLPISKELLENVLTEITRRGFSVPVAQSPPIRSPSVLDRTHSSHILHFTEDSPTPSIDKIQLDSSIPNHQTNSLSISAENSVPLLEQDESTNSTSKKLSSASPIEGILSHSKDMATELTLPDTNQSSPSSSKLPITKELLENVLTEITRRGFSVPVAQSLPIKSPSVLDRTHSSHIPHFTEDSPTPAIHKIQLDPSIPNHLTNSLPISAENSEPLPIDKTFSELQTSHIPTELSSPIHNLGLDITNKSVSDIEQDESENSSSKKVSSASPIEGIQPHSKDTPSELILPDTNAPSSSKLPITKGLLENVLSEITRRDFSVPVAQSLPVTSPSVLDRTHSSHIPHFTEDSPTPAIHKIQLDPSIPNHQTNSLPISAENSEPLPIDKTFSESQSLHIPTELSSSIDNLGPDITDKSVSDIEQDESTNSTSKKLSSASPIEGILSHSKDTATELTIPDTNQSSPSSSKLPITKELLENVLTEITRRGFSVPVAQSLPIKSPSVLDRTHSSHIPHFTEDSPTPAIHKIQLDPSIPNHQTNSLPISAENSEPLPIDKTFSELQTLHIPTELSSPIDNLGLDINNKSVPGIEQDQSENLSSKKFSGDLYSASPLEIILSHSKDTPSELTLPDTNAPSSSKLPITKELLENVLTEITRRGFSIPVAQSLPIRSPSVLDRTHSSHIPHFTEDSPTPAIHKIQLDPSIPNHQTNSLPISAENSEPLPIDKTFSELQTSHIPTELSSPIHNLGLDITNKSVSDIEQDESENSSSKKVSSASPIEGIQPHSKDTPSELILPDTNAPSSSKLPITKELLENVLSEITRRDFSVPVAQSLPVTSPSVLNRSHSSHIPHFTEDGPRQSIDKILLDPSIPNHQTDSLPNYAENVVPLSIDKTFSELQNLHIPTELSSPIHNLGLDITNKSVSDIEQDESENSSSKKVSLASPIEGIQPHSKDTPSELILPDTNAPSSSKLPITKELLENVLTEITRRGFSIPVAQSLPIRSPSVLDRTHSSHIPHFTEDSPTPAIHKIQLDPSIPNHQTNSLPISAENSEPLPIDKTFSELQTSHIPTELSSPIHNLGLDITNKSVSDIEQDESENSSSKKVSSASPIEGIQPHSKDTPSELILPDTNAPSSSKLPITKELLENVLSEITRRDFSVPVAQSLPVTSPSVLNRSHSSHIPHFTEDGPRQSIDKILLDPSIPNHQTDSLPNYAENVVPLSIDKTFSELQNLHIPTELSSPIHNLGLDITNKSVSDIEQDESENSSSKKVSLASPIEGIQPHSKDTPSDLILPDTNTPSSSKLPITKQLLENVLSEITRRGFSVPVAQSLPIRSPSVLDRTHSSHIPHFTEDSPTPAIHKIQLDPSIPNHQTNSLPISAENSEPLPIDKTFSELQTSHIPTELSSPIHNLGLDITNKSVSDIEQDESENSSSKKVSSASPIEGIQPHSKDTPSELILPDTNAPSSSKLPITKELLENVLSEITRRDFSVPVAQSLPVTSPSVLNRSHSSHIPHFTEDGPRQSIDKILLDPSIPNHQTDSLPNFAENVVPLSIDKRFSEFQNLHIPTELSSPIDNLGLDINNKSVSGIEQDQSENLSSKKLSGDLSSASPLEIILSHFKDKPSELTLPDTNAPASSKLSMTKELLENVLTEITRRGFSVPVAQSLPIRSPSVLDRTHSSHIPHFTEDSPTPAIHKIQLDPSIPNHQTNSLPISAENSEPLPIDKTFSELQTSHIPTELSSPIHNLGLDITNKSVSDIEQNESENSSSKKVSSASPIEGIQPHSKDTPSELILPDTNAPSSSKLPITKELLENVLSEITRRDFSVPVAQSLPIRSPSVLDRTHSSHIPHFTEDSPTPAIHKIQLDPSIPNHQTNSLPISAENSVPLPIDKTFSESQSLHIPTELSSSIDNFCAVITNKSVSDIEQDESKNSTSKKLSSACPIEGILSHSKDTSSKLTLPDTNAPSSSKLPITKELLENVLSQITRRGFSVPVAQSLPVTSPSVLDRTYSSHIPHVTENSPTPAIDKIQLDLSIHNHQTDSLPVSAETSVPLPQDKMFTESKTLDIPTELSSLIENLGLDISNITMCDIKQEECANSQSDNLTDDLKSALPMEGIPSLYKDTPRDLIILNTKAPFSSKLPITKALLENVMSEITTKGFSVPVAQSLSIKSPSVLDRTHSSHIPHFTENSSTTPVDVILLDSSFSNHDTDNLPISAENSVLSTIDETVSELKSLDIPMDISIVNNLPLPIDKTFSEPQTLDIPRDLSSAIDNLGVDISNITIRDKVQDDLKSASPMEETFSLYKDTSSEQTLPYINALSCSKLPITKDLLENVLSEITRRGFSVPVAQSLLVPPPSMLDKPHCSLISHFTEDCFNPPVDNIDILPNSAENNAPLPIDKTYSKSQSLHIPTVLSLLTDNLGLDISNITMCDTKQEECANPPSDNLTADLKSALPMEGIPSLYKDIPNEPTLPNTKAPSSSKILMTKALLENVLSEITSKGFSVPVAQSHPATSPSVLDKTHYYPLPRFTEDSPTLPVDKIQLDTPSTNLQTDNLPFSAENSVPIPIDETYPELQSIDIPIDISIEDNLLLPIDKMFSESHKLDNPTELSSLIDNLGLDIPNIKMCDIKQEECANPPSENLTDDLKSASPTKGILSLYKDTPAEPPLTNTKAPSSSKILMTKALLENVLSEISSKGFSVPVAQSHPITSPSVLDKTHYYPLPHFTEHSPTLPVDKVLIDTPFTNLQTDNLPISAENSMPLPIDKTFSKSQSLDILKELSSPVDNIGLDIPNITIRDKVQDECANLPSENLTDDLKSASPTKGILSLYKNTPAESPLTNTKAPSSSKILMTKALLENVLSEISSKGFSVPVAQSHPATSPPVLDKTHYYPLPHFTEDSPTLPVDKIQLDTPSTNLQTDNLPFSAENSVPIPIDETYPELQSIDIPIDISIEDNLQLPIDKMFSESHKLDNPTELSSLIDNLGLDIPNITMCDIKQEECANPPSENLTDDLKSASPTKGILSLYKDTPAEPPLTNTKAPSSSKILMTKALLENVLSEISSKGFSVPVAQSHPITSPSVLDKTHYYPLPHFTEHSPTLPVDKVLIDTPFTNLQTDNLPISAENSMPLPIDKTFSTSQSLDILKELSSPVDNIGPDIPNITIRDKVQDECANPPSENLTEDLKSTSPMKGILSLYKDIPNEPTLPNTNAPSSSKILMTKALLENVLSEISSKGFSVPVAQSHPITSPSVLDKTHYYPLPHFTEHSPTLPVDKVLIDTPFTNLQTDNLPISAENSMPLPIDKTFSTSQSLDILKELSSPVDNIGPDIPNITIRDKVQDECTNLPSENLTDDLKSASPTKGILSLYKNTPAESPLTNTKAPSSSKILMTKALLENVLSEISSKGFSVPVAQSHPATSPPVLDKTHYYPLPHFTEDSPTLPVDKIQLDTPSTNLQTDNLPFSAENSVPILIDETYPELQSIDIPIDISIEDNLQLPIDKMFSESHKLDNPTELSSLIDNLGLDIPNITMCDIKQEECANLPSENLTDDLKSASPTKGILSLYKDTPAEPPLTNTKAPSSSKILMTKALLENVLSEISSKGFSVPVAQSHPITSPSVLDKTHYYPLPHFTEHSPTLPVDKVLIDTPFTNLQTDNLPISAENSMPLPIDKTFSTSQSLDILKELSSPVDNIGPDIPNITIRDKVQDECANPPSENLTEDLKSTSPMKGILSLYKDIPNEPTLPNTNAPSSSKILMTKALLENVLSEISSKGFSVPVAQSHPITSPSVLDKTHYYPLPHFTEHSPTLPVDKVLIDTPFTNLQTDNLPISAENSMTLPIDETYPELQSIDIPIDIPIEDNLQLPIDKTFLESHKLDNPTELSSLIDNLGLDIPNITMCDIKQEECANPPSENLTDDLKSASPTKGILSLYKDTPAEPTLPNTKAPSSSKILMTKALLENVRSEISSKGFSVPVAQSHPATSPPVLDKTHYYPLPHFTEDSPTLPVDKIQLDTPSTNLQTDNLPFSAENSVPILIDETYPELQSIDIPIDIPIEDNLQLPIDKTFLESHKLDNPTELSSLIDNLGLDIPNITMCDIKQEECANPPSENLTDDLKSASPTKGILSLYKDTPAEPTLPNTKAPSSSKILITKALLENVLSEISSKGLSVPVPQSHPITSPSVLDKTHYYPLPHFTEDSPRLPVDKFLIDTPFTNLLTDDLPIFAENSMLLPIDETYPEFQSIDIHTDISIEDNLQLPIDKTFSESQSLDIPTDLSSAINNLGVDTSNITMCDIKQNECINPPSENLTDDLKLASPMEGTLSHYKDMPSELTLPNTKTPSSSKLPITKALLENVLSNIKPRGFSLPVAQALLVVPPKQLDKMLYFLETPVSGETKKSSVIPTDRFPSSEISEDVAPRPIDTTLQNNPILGIPKEGLLMDKILNSDNLSDVIGQDDNSEILNEDVEDRDNSDDWNDTVEYSERDISDHFNNDFKDKDYWSDDIEIEDTNESLFSDDPADDVPNNLSIPRIKSYLTSRISTVRNILEIVFSGITDRRFYP